MSKQNSVARPVSRLLQPTAWDHDQGRRVVLRAGLAFGAISLVAPLGLAHGQQPSRPTAMEVIGPFYPVSKPSDQDTDLTQVTGRSGRAQGQVLYLTGRVLARSGEPIPGAVLEVWQANAAGRYAHAGDRTLAPEDPDFQGYARLVTDSEGRYAIKTVKPGPYPASRPGWMRPPHIHFDVTGKVTRLVTAMYFEGDPLNEQDLLLKVSFAPQTQMTRLEAAAAGQEPDALRATWDIVLITG